MDSGPLAALAWLSLLKQSQCFLFVTRKNSPLMLSSLAPTPSSLNIALLHPHKLWLRVKMKKSQPPAQIDTALRLLPVEISPQGS